MADGFGPDEELESRAERLRQARLALAKIRRPEQELREDLGLPYGPLLPGESLAVARADSQAYYNSPEARAAEFAEKSLAQGVEDHPENQYRQIMKAAANVKAPQLSDWDWFRQNPGFLTAQPLSEYERTANARLDFILRRVHKAQQGQNPHDQMSWANYSGPLAGDMGEFTVAAAEAHGGQGLPGSPAYLESLRSPYRHRKAFRDEQGRPLPWYDKESGHYPLMAEGAQLGATALFYGKFPRATLGFNALSTAHNSAIPALQHAYQGRAGEALDALARSPLGVLNSGYAPGRPGGPHDWRPGVPSELATTADVLAQAVPMFVSFPGRRASGQQIRQLVDPDALKAAYQKAAWRHHPDYGGSNEAMQMLNRLREMGDVRGIARMAQ